MASNEMEVDDENETKPKNFHELELDDRILKAISKLGWAEPTLIQEKAIPLMMEGKDILIRARTGSGKTAAFTIPLIQKILSNKRMQKKQEIKGLIVAPSKELCKQIHDVIICLTVKCSREVKVIDVSPQLDLSAQKPLLAEKPDIVVGTPSRLLQHLKANNMKLKQSLETLIIDEADLVFSFGYEDEIKSLLNYLPIVYQAALASATLSEDVVTLKKLVLRNPAILKLEEPPLAPLSQLSHYSLAAEENDKAAILYALLKLHLVRGKTIIFVNTVDRCYKLKLFLEQFGIPTCVLNSELPAVSRCRAVTQFNSGTYDIIIASDEKSLEEPHIIKVKRGRRKKDKESGVARGIDFQFVSNVINFDFPQDVNSYIHRAGRTARGKNQGTALSFVSIRERPLLEQVESELKHCYNRDTLFKTYQFKLEEVEGFRYRAKDAWKAVTRIAVREARLKEIKQEVLNCQKLKSYFEDNPKDLQSLRQDKALHTVKLQSHLKDVPEYIVPPTLKRLVGTNRKRKFNREAAASKPTATQLKYQARASNPLVSLQIKNMK
ncbi:probable ATP-dependent RNA helicase DDX56 [Bombus vosnesenskii]|uniref:RNA helicase n=3 Tax=Pyrobombus TaxID=144703 RepID=A0A6J3JUC5_9HYME|nr:probable ATP-dependent RNA helicase DDX56 [Bombus bifarius]XP_033343931.1 probable ATP-dependent RNA helicase DDX56 [Bombus vosnesenskii]XP_050483679.1 probable ATP-dependent RNA helicase DDX56 isoform X1 [Bombus huntii]